MPRFTELRISFAERKLLRWIFFFYCLFILYGSFIPFRFSDDPEFVRSQFVRFFAPPYDHGVRRFSLPDVVSNVLLFVPFGLLWVGGEFSLRWQSCFWRVAFTAGLLGLLSGLVIESGQMFSPGRIASILDALCNGIGSATGAAAGYLLFRAFRGSFGLILLQLLRERPSLVLLAMLLIVSMADAYYPFDVTLDVSTVWQNVKNTRLIPFVGMRRFWLDLLVEKTLLYAAIGYLALRNLPLGTARNPKLAWLACSTIALIIEAGKHSLRGDHRTSIAFSSAVSAPWLELFWFHSWPRQALPAGTRERFSLYWFFASLPTWSSLHSIGFDRETRFRSGLPKSNGLHSAPIILPSHRRHFST